MPYIGAGIQRFNTADNLTVSGTSELKNNVTVTGDVTASGTVLPTGDTAAGDAAALGFTSTEGLILTGQGSTSDVVIKNDADTTVCFVPTGTDDLKFNDTAAILMGTDSDMQIIHDGNNSIISDNGTGNLVLRSNAAAVEIDFNTDETAALFNHNGSVELYHDNTKRIETTSVGVGVDQLFGLSDTDTGIALGANGANIMQFYTGNSERARIDANGNLLVGATSSVLDANTGIQAAGPIESTHSVVQESNSIRSIMGNDGGSGVLGTSTNHAVKMFANNTNTVTFNTNGDLTVNDGDLVIGTSGHGISFAATSDASGSTSELLDDFEEGTWTPVLTTSSGTPATYGAQQIGKYVKIGTLVHIFFDIAINQINNSNTTLVSGHPFNSVNNDALAVSFFSTLAVSPVFVQFQCVGSSGFMAVGLTSAGTNITNGMGIFGNSARIIASGTYRTN